MAQTRVGIRNGALFNNNSTLWNNLLAYYTGDNTPDDALGNYNGILTNGANYGTGKINQGFSFDGVNDYVNLGNIPLTSTNDVFSRSCWINVPSFGTNYAMSILNQYASTGTFMFSYNGLIYCTVASGSYPNELRKVTTVPLSTSTWYHIVYTYDGSCDVTGLNIYINGVLATVTSPLNNCISTTISQKKLNLSLPPSSFKYFNGLIDEVGIWDRELTSTEVTELYNSGSGKQYPN